MSVKFRALSYLKSMKKSTVTLWGKFSQCRTTGMGTTELSNSQRRFRETTHQTKQSFLKLSVDPWWPEAKIYLLLHRLRLQIPKSRKMFFNQNDFLTVAKHVQLVEWIYKRDCSDEVRVAAVKPSMIGQNRTWCHYPLRSYPINMAVVKMVELLAFAGNNTVLIELVLLFKTMSGTPALVCL